MKRDLLLKKNTHVSNAVILRWSGGFVVFLIKTVSLCRRDVGQRTKTVPLLVFEKKIKLATFLV